MFHKIPAIYHHETWRDTEIHKDTTRNTMNISDTELERAIRKAGANPDNCRTWLDFLGWIRWAYDYGKQQAKIEGIAINQISFYTPGNHTEFWHELSWRVGDEHANRICKLLIWYCKLFKLNQIKFHSTPPNR